MKTLAQQWMKEGAEREAPKAREEARKEGYKEVIEEIAINMLNLGADIELIIKCCEIPREKVESLSKQNTKEASDTAG